MVLNNVVVTLPDGSRKDAQKGICVGEFIKHYVGTGLWKASVFARLNGQDVDLSRSINEDASLQVFTTKSPEALEIVRHDAAHVVADAVQRLFPGTQVTIGPTIEDGFYYDFCRATPFSPQDLEAIEKVANEIVQADMPFVHMEVASHEAIALFQSKGERFKVEIIGDIVSKGAASLTLYKHGDWIDFCLGPHGPSTGRIGVIKILSSSGAYWRGDHRNPMLQRIYGTAFFDKKALQTWLDRREEASKRDHRRLGKELDLFYFHHFSPGATFWTPKGTALYRVLSDYIRKLAVKNGYLEIHTPMLFNKGLWEMSGHWGKYKENMFLVFDSEAKEHNSSLKPMNCPSHHLYYGFKQHSYRELPLRFYTQDVLHRSEITGALGGLTRMRQFAQDDAHIYCREDQIAHEVASFVKLLSRVYSAVGLEYRAKLSTRPSERIGSDELWDRSEAALMQALKSLALDYILKPGEGAFYGPKIDFDVSDSIGRHWQLGTIQLDYNAPERFQLTYVGEDNAEHRPVVLHRAILGSFERFIAILIEHFAGAFPTWLAPVQARIVYIADRHLTYAKQVASTLVAKDFRVDIDERGMSMQRKIAESMVQKIPFTLVIGDREVEQSAIAPRRYGGMNLKTMPLAQFIALLEKEAAVL